MGGASSPRVLFKRGNSGSRAGDDLRGDPAHLPDRPGRRAGRVLTSLCTDDPAGMREEVAACLQGTPGEIMAIGTFDFEAEYNRLREAMGEAKGMAKGEVMGMAKAVLKVLHA